MSPVREVADGRRVGVWTRDTVADALREYAKLYGDDFPQAAFSPAAAKIAGRPDLVDRYYAPRAGGSSWPSLNAIKRLNGGSFTRAREYAGFEANSTMPARGRRPAGSLVPIRDVRERVRWRPSGTEVELRRELENVRRRLTRTQERVVELRARGPVVRERVERQAVVKVKTKTRTVRVKDTRALERLAVKLADAQAARRAAEDQTQAAVRDRNSAERRVADVLASLAESRSEAERVADECKSMEARLIAAEARVDRLRGEVAQARDEAASVEQAAMAADLVAAAERRVEHAELRAARAEREMVEQAATITGERRKLTRGELAELRRSGPAGEKMLAEALRKLARARSATDRGAALWEVAAAAVSWRERLNAR